MNVQITKVFFLQYYFKVFKFDKPKVQLLFPHTYMSFN
jgi:hypothetical protein